MNKKTNDYDMFKFRDDNRAAISQDHVNRLAESIKSRNLLDLRPIIVNKNMEVLDGQHRLLAAKKLGCEIYYQVDDRLNSADIILMNVSKAWNLTDYTNFYCKQGNSNYIKFSEFLKKNKIQPRTAINLIIGESKTKIQEFKRGEFLFNEEYDQTHLDYCWETIEYLKRMKGYCAFSDGGRFWKALIKMIQHDNFDMKLWRVRIERFIDRICPKANYRDYLCCFLDIYNWNNTNKIHFM